MMTDGQMYDDQYEQYDSADNTNYGDSPDYDGEMDYHHFIRNTAIMEARIAAGLLI